MHASTPGPARESGPCASPDEALARLVLSSGDLRSGGRRPTPLSSLALRRELARLEADIGLCDRCFGHEPRWVTRFERPSVGGRILLLSEQAPRALLEAQTRMGLESDDNVSRLVGDLVRQAGLPPEECVMAAAILCHPRSRKLERAVPRSSCLRECSAHVRAIILALRPRLVVPMGRSAVHSLRVAFPANEALGDLRFPSSIGQTIEAGDTCIRPVYLPTRRSRVHRSAEEQQHDWREIGGVWKRITQGAPRSAPGKREIRPI